MQRSGWLVLVLAINPLIAIVATILKAYLHHTPVSDSFGLVSVLSATSSETLSSLRGAALSGRLQRELRASFQVVDDGDDGIGNTRSGHVEVCFGDSRPSGRLRRGVAYS